MKSKDFIDKFSKAELEKFKEIKDRAIFKKGEQKRFLKEAKVKLGIKWTEFEDLVLKAGYSDGSLRNWRSETCSIPLSIVHLISSISEVKMPEAEIRHEQWGRIKGGKGALEKLGLNELRKRAQKGRKVTLEKHGLDAFQKFASSGGSKASKMKLGIFADANKENAKEWRKIPFKEKIGIFDKKYDGDRNSWRFKGFLNSPKRNVPTKLGIKVRSKDEKRILEFLSDSGFQVNYEKCQVFAKDNHIVPDFGFADRPKLFVEYLGRSDDAYWKYKIPRWRNVLKNCNAKFIIISYDLEKAKAEFDKLSNVIGILKFGQWRELKDLLSNYA